MSAALASVNLRLGETALELLAWDKSRTSGRLPPDDLVETDRLMNQGAICHRRLLAMVHGDRAVALEESEAWLADSRAGWHGRPEMVEKGSWLSGPRLRLTKEDVARIDRIHPGRSFSGTAPDGAEAVAGLAGQLERIAALHESGLLTADEFAEAKAQLLRRSSRT